MWYLMSRKRKIVSTLLILLLTVSTTFGYSPKAKASSDGKNSTSKQGGSTASPDEESSEEVNVLTDENDLFIDALNATKEEIYITATAEVGKVEQKEVIFADLYYPKYELVRLPSEYGTVEFGEFLVKSGDMVKKGTPLISITTKIDEVSLEQKNLELKRLQEAYNRFVSSQPILLREQKNALGSINDQMDKKIATLEYEKAQLNYEISKKAQEKTIAELKEDINKTIMIKNTKEVVAPTDGLVRITNTISKGEKFDYTRDILSIANPSEILFKVSDERMQFRYNMNATIALNPNSDGTSKNKMSGKVIYSEPPIIEDYGIQYGMCYIKPDKKVSYAELSKAKIQITIDVCVMEDVLYVPLEFVNIDEQMLYEKNVATVYELQDGNLVEREVAIGVRNQMQCQIIEGIDKGTTIVKKQ